MRQESENRPRSNYFSSLRKISDHPFVTPESRDRRQELAKYLLDLQNMLGPQVRVVVIPVGSTGVGLAVAESDIDAIVFLDSEIPDDEIDWKAEALKLTYSNSLGDITVKDLNSTLDNALREIASSRRLYSHHIDALAFIFAPSIREDGDLNSVINKMRKKVLERIVHHPLKKAIWKKIRENIKLHLIRYELLDLGGTEIMRTKRPKRYQEIIEEAILGRLRLRDPDIDPDSPKISRAKRLIEAMRASYTFPSLESVCEEFGVI